MKKLFIFTMLLTGCIVRAASPALWHAKLVQLAPAGDHYLATLCLAGVYCRPWRFNPKEGKWERLYIRDEQPESSYDSASYSKDGKTIVTSRQSCEGGKCDYLSAEVVLISVADGAQQTVKTTRPSLMPSMGADGNIFFWGLRSVVEMPAKGTTPYPSRKPVYIAAHDLFMIDPKADPKASIEKQIVEVNAQLPLAPPKVLHDGNRVIVAANQIRGGVMLGSQLIRPWTPAVNYATRSVILANVRSGVMTAISPNDEQAALLLDVGCKDSLALIGKYGLLFAHDMATGARRMVTGDVPHHPLGALGPYKHAAISQDCASALVVLGYSAALIHLNETDSWEPVKLPEYQEPSR